MKYLLLGILFLVLVIMAALSTSADAFIGAYVDLQTQPESVSDIVMRSRTTASAPDPHRQNGMWFGAGLLAIVLIFIAGLFAVMFGGERLLRQWRLAFRKGKRGHSQPPAYTPPYVSGPQQETLPTPTAGRTPQIPTWSSYEEEDGF